MQQHATWWVGLAAALAIACGGTGSTPRPDGGPPQPRPEQPTDAGPDGGGADGGPAPDGGPRDGSALPWSQLTGEATPVVRLAPHTEGTVLVTREHTLQRTGDTPFLELARVAPDGRATWTRRFNAEGTGVFASLTTSASGDIYLAGSLALPGAVDFGCGRTEGPGFLVKLTPDGRCAWMRAPLGPSFNPRQARLHAVAVGQDGKLLVAGDEWADTYGLREFVLGLSADGTPEWEHTLFADGGHLSARALAALPGGAWVLGGYLSGSLPLGGATVESRGAVLVRLGRAGALEWSKGLPVDSVVRAVALDPSSGDVFAAGSFTGSFTWAGTPVDADAKVALFLAALRADGTERWVQVPERLDVEAAASELALAVGAPGGVWLAGWAASDESRCVGSFVRRYTTGGEQASRRALSVRCEEGEWRGLRVRAAALGEGVLMLGGELQGEADLGTGGVLRAVPAQGLLLGLTP